MKIIGIIFFAILFIAVFICIASDIARIAHDGQTFDEWRKQNDRDSRSLD